MLFHFVIFLAMAGFGFGFDDNDFSLSGLTKSLVIMLQLLALLMMRIMMD